MGKNKQRVLEYENGKSFLDRHPQPLLPLNRSFEFPCQIEILKCSSFLFNRLMKSYSDIKKGGKSA